MRHSGRRASLCRMPVRIILTSSLVYNTCSHAIAYSRHFVPRSYNLDYSHSHSSELKNLKSILVPPSLPGLTFVLSHTSYIAHHNCTTSRQTRKSCTFDELPPERKKTMKRPSSSQDDLTRPLASPSSHLAGSSSLNGNPHQPGPQKHQHTRHHQGGESVKRQRTSDLEGMHALVEAATQAEYHHGHGYGGAGVQQQPRYLPHPTHARNRWSYGMGGGYTPYGAVGHGVAANASSSAASSMPKPNEPASFDLSVSENLTPHVITVLLTDDLLPIGARKAGPESSGAEVGATSSSSNGQEGSGSGGVGGKSSGYIRQVSVDRNRPQVGDVFTFTSVTPWLASILKFAVLAPRWAAAWLMVCSRGSLFQYIIFNHRADRKYHSLFHAVLSSRRCRHSLTSVRRPHCLTLPRHRFYWPLTLPLIRRPSLPPSPSSLVPS